MIAPGTSGFAEVAARWPQVIRDGAIDRPALAAIVFADPKEREALNAIVHPRVRARAAEIEQTAGSGIVIQVVPLLFESDFWKQCDATIAVVAPRETRIARVQARDGLTREEIERRMAAQIDPQEAAARATYVIENAGSRSELESATAAVSRSLQARCCPPPEHNAKP